MPDEPERDADRGHADPSAERRIRRALTEIRREGWKVAVVYAAVDAAAVALFANLVATVSSVPGLPGRLPLPEVTLRALEAAGAAPATPTVATGAAVGVALGAVAFAVEVGWRVRRPLVEQFESANPQLREALRTARDAVEDGARSRMALRLYEDVLEDLRDASSAGLLNLGRVAATMLAITVISVATIQLAVVDLPALGADGPAGTDSGAGTEPEYGGLRNGSSILGDPENVSAGEETLDATVDTGGAGSGGADADTDAAYSTGGFDDSATVEVQRAGFSEREDLEDAELIREYNLQIRETDEET
jgi:hypothetical protein